MLRLPREKGAGQKTGHSEKIAQTQRKMRKLTMDVILYTRQGCHLCDDALALLERHGLKPQLIDIDQDPQLREKYDCCVPVVAFNGKVRFRGRVNEVLLRRLLKAKSGPLRNDRRESSGESDGAHEI